MTFQKLEKICILLWGQSWQSELARHLDIDPRTVNKWKTQGVAKWVDSKMDELIDLRLSEVNEAVCLVRG